MVSDTTATAAATAAAGAGGDGREREEIHPSDRGWTKGHRNTSMKNNSQLSFA